jgi:hypothetical protein
MRVLIGLWLHTEGKFPPMRLNTANFIGSMNYWKWRLGTDADFLRDREPRLQSTPITVVFQPQCQHQGQLYYAMDPLSISASIAALLQLSAVVVKFLSDVKGAPDDRKRLLFEVSNIKGLLSTIQDLAQPGEPWLGTVQSLSAPNGPLEQCWSLLKRLDEKLAPVVGLNKVRKALAWPFQKGEIKDILCAIEQLKTLFGLALQNDNL